MLFYFGNIFFYYFCELFLINDNCLTMNINDNDVIDNLNTLIVSHRLNRNQILKMLKLVSISKDIQELKDNLNWEES